MPHKIHLGGFFMRSDKFKTRLDRVYHGTDPPLFAWDHFHVECYRPVSDVVMHGNKMTSP